MKKLGERNKRNSSGRRHFSCLAAVCLNLAVLVTFLWARYACAQPEGDLINKEGDLATKWKVNDADPKSNIPSVEERNKDPLEFAYFLQDLASRAEGAFHREDWKSVIKYYEALGHAVPESWISFNRLCLAYAKVGHYAIAAANCGRAVSLPMAKVIDHIRLIDYSLKSERFGATDVQNIEQSLAHLRKHVAEHPQPPAVPSPATTSAAVPPVPDKRTREELIEAIKQRQQKRADAILAGEDPNQDKEADHGPVMHLPSEIEFLTCKFAVRIEDAQRLGACIDALTRLNVSDGQVLAFSWAKALISKDRKSADQLLEKARALGVPQATLAGMMAQQQQHFPPTFTAKRVLVALGFALSFCVLGLGVARTRRKKLGSAHGQA